MSQLQVRSRGTGPKQDLGTDPAALKDLIENSGLSFRQNARSWVFTCPKCDKKDKLFIQKTDGRFICFYCSELEGFRGRPEYALTLLLGLPLPDLRRRLYGADKAHQGPSGELSVELKDLFDELEEVPEDLVQMKPVLYPLDFVPIGHRHAQRGQEYLEGRGVSLALAQTYGLHYSPKDRRVVFPVQREGKLYGWQARTVLPSEWEDLVTGEKRTIPKILTSKGLMREFHLMFEDRLKGSPHVVLCEGPLDALKAHLCGGNVATMGKMVSLAQLRLLKSYGVQRFYLALDPDAADEIARLTRDLGDSEVYLIEPTRKDLGEHTPEEALGLFQQARRVNGGQIFIYLNPRPVQIRGQRRTG